MSISPLSQLPMASWDLAHWLEYIAATHPSEIELGLSRVEQVYKRLDISWQGKTIVTVAGTNGKGTTCMMLEQAGLMIGKSCAVYSSPHLLDYRERVRINGQILPESHYCQAFYQVEQARQDTQLTYFEYATLAAFMMVQQSNVEIVLLEVGLGGRLDAVNVVDPNIAVITSIDIDHKAWLGDNREDIAKEKAGIFRANIPVVIGEPDPPHSLQDAAKKLGVKAYWQGQDFGYEQEQNTFSWHSKVQNTGKLPKPHIPSQNASTALQVLELLDIRFDDTQLLSLFERSTLAGRRQRIQDAPLVMLDVAHNPESCRLLAKDMAELGKAQMYFVCGMLKDKDIEQSLAPMLALNATWLVADLNVPRGASAKQLNGVLAAQQSVLQFTSVSKAYQHALGMAQEQDLILVFGSFYTVAEVMQGLSP